MKCSLCQFENREDHRFCAHCGAALALTCGACGFTNDPAAQFCGGCGTALGADATAGKKAQEDDDEKTPETDDYVAEHAERRHLTVMFVDVVGSTSLFQELDPEDVREILRRYRESCADIIGRFEGTIARYLGDGLLVYFGYPQAHEDDAQRAVQAGLEIVEAVKRMPVAVPRQSRRLAVRIGIATGLVVVGEIVSGRVSEDMSVIGHTPNLAARLQTLASPNTVVVNASTRQLIDGMFILKDLGPTQIKGLSEPVAAFEVVGVSGAPSRFEAAASRGLTPLVGRREEIDMLTKRWEDAKAGEGQLLLISGEPGIGKSRILKGFEATLAGTPRFKISYFCSPYHQNSAFYPVVEQLKRGFRIEAEDSAERRLERISKSLKELHVASSLAPAFASLLAVMSGKAGPEETSGAQYTRNQILSTLLSAMEQMAKARPVLLIVEDAQWADPSTLELLAAFVGQLKSSAFLLVITARPEFQSPWDDYPNASSIKLNRLTNRECQHLILEVTGQRALPDHIVAQIMQKADGIPLFVEELTKTVMESGVVHGDGDTLVADEAVPPFAIPASLHDSLMARLDRLLPVKEVAQLASVFGRTFQREHLISVSTRSADEIDESLGALISAGLVYKRGIESTFEFKHALVADAAYQSMLRSTKEYYHRRIAGMFETLEAKSEQVHPEVIAHHHMAAGDPAKAVPYLRMAGLHASERSANLEAIAHLSKALEIVEAMPDSQDLAGQELDLRLVLNGPLIAAKGYSSELLKDNFTRSFRLCRSAEESHKVFPLKYAQWVYSITTGTLQQAYDLAREFLADAEQTGDETIIMIGHRVLGPASFIVGKPQQAVEHLEQAIAGYDAKRHRSLVAPYGQDVKAASLCYLALSLWTLGHAQKAMRCGAQALEHAMTLHHAHTTGNALGHAGAFLRLLARAPDAEAHARRVLEFAVEHELPVWKAAGNFYLGWALAQRENHRQGFDLMHKARGELDAINFLYWRPLVLACMAESAMALKDFDDASRYLDSAEEIAARSGERWFVPEILRIRGTLREKSSPADGAAAEACYAKALETAHAQGAAAWALRAAVSLAELWRCQGRSGEIGPLLKPVIDAMPEKEATADSQAAAALLRAAAS